MANKTNKTILANNSVYFVAKNIMKAFIFQMILSVTIVKKLLSQCLFIIYLRSKSINKKRTELFEIDIDLKKELKKFDSFSKRIEQQKVLDRPA